jgi:hypothetical protein
MAFMAVPSGQGWLEIVSIFVIHELLRFQMEAFCADDHALHGLRRFGSARGRRLLLGLRKRGGRPYHGGEQDQSSDFHVILQRVNKKILNEFYPQTHLFSCHGLEFVACPAGFEPATLSLEVKGFGH